MATISIFGRTAGGFERHLGQLRYRDWTGPIDVSISCRVGRFTDGDQQKAIIDLDLSAMPAELSSLRIVVEDIAQPPAPAKNARRF